MSSIAKAWQRVGSKLTLTLKKSSHTSHSSHTSSSSRLSVFKPRKKGPQKSQAIRLPIELFSLVVHYVWVQDLYSLLFVCRFMHAEAERMLYAYITLGNQIHDGFGYNGRHASLFNTLQYNGRVAHYVLSMELSIRSQSNRSLNPYWVSLHHTLTRLPNLRTLILRLELDSPLHGPPAPLFDNCTFQLKTISIRGATFVNSGVVSLRGQTEIEDLALGLTENVDFDTEVCFPKLKVLVASDASRTNALVERDSLKAVHLLDKCTLLRVGQRPNIAALRMSLSYTNQLSILGYFPSLRYLRIDKLTLPTFEYARKQLTSLKHLQSLRKLHLDLLEPENYASAAPINLGELAQETFAYILPQLCTLVVGYGVPPYQEWTRGYESFDYVSTDDDEWKRTKWWDESQNQCLRSTFFY